MQLLLVLTSSLFVFSASGQTEHPESYLLVRIERAYDNTNQRAYFSINAEKGCEDAYAIYSLLKYDNRKNADNRAMFYHAVKKSTDSLYNYFLSPTEVLNYIAKLGWGLVSVFTETSSGYDHQRNGSGDLVPITTITSRPVFCFKR